MKLLQSVFGLRLILSVISVLAVATFMLMGKELETVIAMIVTYLIITL